MNTGLQFLLLYSLSIILSSYLYSQTIPIDSLYLGQTAPDDTPKVFLRHSHARLAITNDGGTIYYCSTAADGSDYANICYYKYFNNKWNGPFKLFDGFIAPTFSKNEDTLYTMTYNDQSYYSLRLDSVWSTPSLISQDQLYYLQVTDLGNYYCGAENSAGSIGQWDICKVDINSGRAIYQNLGHPVNTDNNDVEFFMAKDESYMVLGANEVVNAGGRDLYISYKKNDGTWTSPKSLGPLINDGPHNKWGPFVTADNRYLFYSRLGGSDFSSVCLYWVRFDRLLDSLRYTNFPPYVKSSIPNQKAFKDFLFTYQIPDSTFYDEDLDPLTYSATLQNGHALPGWLSFDTLTCTFSGTPPSERIYSLKVTAMDPSYTRNSSCFVLNVIGPEGVEENNNQLPEKWKLFQNYPNPFNPSTKIQYSLVKSSYVKLTIYNILGQKIRTLHNSFQSAGEHFSVWDASDDHGNMVSSGLYIYKLEANGQTLQKKMLLIR